MSYYIIDVESDGPILGVNSLVCFGAVRLDNELQTTYYGQTCPIGESYNEEALAISGFPEKNMSLLKIRKLLQKILTFSTVTIRRFLITTLK